VRVRASAGAASFRRHSTLEECRSAAQEAVRQLRAEADGDAGAASRRRAAAQLRAAEDRERRVEAALAVTQDLQARQRERAVRRAERAFREARKRSGAKPDAKPDEAPKSDAAADKEPRASTTDAQARVMKMADGGFRPAYNVQFASDTLSGAVAGVSADNIGSDMGKMAPMNEALAERYGRRPGQHLADGGFAKLDDIEALEQAGVAVYAPVPMPRDKSRERYAAQPDDPPGVATWRQRMGGDAAKLIYRQRAATAECVNAQARNRGLTQFFVRGIDKVKVIALWHALAHNMACTWRLAQA
jgi:Transposase DDE domain